MGNHAVFGVYDIDDLKRSSEIDRSGPRIATFRGPGIKHPGPFVRGESRPNLPAASSEPQAFGAHVNKYILVAALFAATSASAQIRRRAPVATEPSLWISLGVGLYGANEVSDGATNSTWDFGEGTNWQYRAAVEKVMQNQFSLGGVLTYVDVPFVYIGPSCGRCDAHLDLTTVGASFHAGGGTGLHQVLEVSAGAALYRNLRRDSDDLKLAPQGGNIDPFFTFAYGFGYTFNPTLQISIIQDYGLVLHERTGLSNDQSNTLTQRTTRLNLRMGFGSRTRRR